MSKKEKNEDLRAFRNWVKQRFRQDLDPGFLFHNWAYSDEIEGAVRKLAKEDGKFEDTELTALRIAALAYPLGCIELDPDDLQRQLQNDKGAIPDLSTYFLPHSQELLRTYLQENRDFRGSLGETDPISFLVNLNNSSENSKAEKLLKDAINGWYGRNRFGRRSEVMSLELQAILGDQFNPMVFEEELKKRMLAYNYESKAGISIYEKKRRKNIRDQQKNLIKTEKVETRRRTGKDLGRGIDTMYRTAFRNHINLSRIADGKANMMISINTIILSILLAISGAGIGFFQDLMFERPLMLLPIITLLLSSLIAVVFAVFSARPKVTEYRIKKAKKLIKSPDASLLYFGNFLKLEKSEFVRYLDDLKYQQDELYQDLARDLYDLGQVLHRKYLLLTISYNTFVGGLALSVLLFLVVYGLNIW